MTNNFSEGKHYDERGRARQWEREKDKSLSAELPTGPRAMDLDAEPPMFSRRGRSPPLERTGRSPPSHFPINGPRKSDRRDHLAPSELRFSTNAPDRSQRERDYQSGRRVGEVCGLKRVMFSADFRHRAKNLADLDPLVLTLFLLSRVSSSKLIDQYLVQTIPIPVSYLFPHASQMKNK